MGVSFGHALWRGRDARDGDGDGKVQDGTPFERPAKENRVTKPEEKR